jgi:hypothetical protein
MKLTAIGLATALALTSTMAFAQSGIGTTQSGIRGNSVSSGGSGASGFSTGSSTRRSNTSDGGGLGDNAGGITEGTAISHSRS